MEELKIILATIETIGATGSWMFYAYLVKSLTVGILFAGTVLLVVRMATHSISAIVFGCEIRDILGVGSSGELTSSERSSVRAKIGELMSQGKQS